ncbi:MAG: glycosyltransferase family 39 protein, partial [Omnitrophica WOR_2 bacterium]
YNRILLSILFLSVLFRTAAAVYMGNQVVDLPGTADQISYHNLALRVLGGHGFSFGQDWWPATPANAPTAHWSFLYTFYLVFVYMLFGAHPVIARLIQAVLVGILQPLLVYLIGRRVFNQPVALISAAIAALYAYFIYYGGTLMTESFYITAILCSLYLAMLLATDKKTAMVNQTIPRDLILALLLGLSLGIAVLLRQLYGLFIPLLFAWIWWVGRKVANKHLALPILIAGEVLVFMILPFTLYNTIRFGHFVLLNTNSGFAFFWGNHPVYGTHFLPLLPDYHALIPKELLSLDEAALDQALLLRGFQFVISDPARFILLSISRVPVFFMFWPTSGSGLISNIARVASFGIFWPFMLYGVIRTFAYRPRTMDKKMYMAILLIGFVVIYTGIHLLSWALVRYRLPVDMALIFFAGVALADLWERIASAVHIDRRGVLDSVPERN